MRRTFKKINVFLPNHNHGVYLNAFEGLKSLYGIEAQRIYSPSNADIILFSGGEDVHPTLYGEGFNDKTMSDIYRDKREAVIYKYAVSRKIPMLGICRGAQFLTVMNGGKLIQHVTGHTNNHIITTSEGVSYLVTSTHHQMMYPFLMPKHHYHIEAASSVRISDVYLRQGRTSYQFNEVPEEPEIVIYPKTRSLAIQSHPERMVDTKNGFIDYVSELIYTELIATD